MLITHITEIFKFHYLNMLNIVMLNCTKLSQNVQLHYLITETLNCSYFVLIHFYPHGIFNILLPLHYLINEMLNFTTLSQNVKLCYLITETLNCSYLSSSISTPMEYSTFSFSFTILSWRC